MRFKQNLKSMSKCLGTRLCLVLFLILTSGVALAQNLWSSSEMRRAGIHTESFQPICFSHDDKTLAGFDRASFEEKKNGVFYRVWFIEFDREGKVKETRSVPVELKSLQQGEFSPDDRSFLLIGNRGTTYDLISMTDMKVSPFFKPEPGKPGFRADPAVLWTENNQLLVSGYPYSAERFVGPKTIARIDMASASFENGPELSTLERSLERLWFSSYLTQTSAFFAQKYSGLAVLSYWNSDGIKEISRAFQFRGFWANGGRLLGSSQAVKDGPEELFLYDAKTDQRTVLATSDEPYRYLFLSRDGRTALVSQADEAYGRINASVAQESQNWELRPLKSSRPGAVETLPAGWMRLSSRGKLVCHVSRNGLRTFLLD